jgi:hypothetical protein
MTCFDEEPDHQPTKEGWEAYEAKKHTRGEWYWSARTLRSEIQDIDGDIAERPDILHVGSDKCIYASNADRALIAASPLLLEALQGFVALTERDSVREVDHSFQKDVFAATEKTTRAIAKATAVNG